MDLRPFVRFLGIGATEDGVRSAWYKYKSKGPKRSQIMDRLGCALLLVYGRD